MAKERKHDPITGPEESLKLGIDVKNINHNLEMLGSDFKNVAVAINGMSAIMDSGFARLDRTLSRSSGSVRKWGSDFEKSHRDAFRKSKKSLQDYEDDTTKLWKNAEKRKYENAEAEKEKFQKSFNKTLFLSKKEQAALNKWMKDTKSNTADAKPFLAQVLADKHVKEFNKNADAVEKKGDKLLDTFGKLNKLAGTKGGVSEHEYQAQHPVWKRMLAKAGGIDKEDIGTHLGTMGGVAKAALGAISRMPTWEVVTTAALGGAVRSAVDWNEAMTEQRKQIGLNKEDFHTYSITVNRVGHEQHMTREQTAIASETLAKMGTVMGGSLQDNLEGIDKGFKQLERGAGLADDASKALIEDSVRFMGKAPKDTEALGEAWTKVRRNTVLTISDMQGIYESTKQTQRIFALLGGNSNDFFKNMAGAANVAKLGGFSSLEKNLSAWGTAGDTRTMIQASLLGMDPEEMYKMKRTGHGKTFTGKDMTPGQAQSVIAQKQVVEGMGITGKETPDERMHKEYLATLPGALSAFGADKEEGIESEGYMLQRRNEFAQKKGIKPEAVNLQSKEFQKSMQEWVAKNEKVEKGSGIVPGAGKDTEQYISIKEQFKLVGEGLAQLSTQAFTKTSESLDYLAQKAQGAADVLGKIMPEIPGALGVAGIGASIFGSPIAHGIGSILETAGGTALGGAVGRGVLGRGAASMIGLEAGSGVLATLSAVAIPAVAIIGTAALAWFAGRKIDELLHKTFVGKGIDAFMDLVAGDNGKENRKFGLTKFKTVEEARAARGLKPDEPSQKLGQEQLPENPLPKPNTGTDTTSPAAKVLHPIDTLRGVTGFEKRGTQSDPLWVTSKDDTSAELIQTMRQVGKTLQDLANRAGNKTDQMSNLRADRLQGIP
jgi:hypothetical protein